MLVKLKNTNQVGNINDNEYDPKIYDKVETPVKSTQSGGNTVLDKVLGLAGKAGDFLIPTTMNQYRTALSNFDPNTTPEQAIQNVNKVQGNQWKSGLELGSYLIPYGKGANFLTKAALPALAQYGASQISQDKPLSLGGAGLSVATAGILQKILGLGGKTQRIGEGATESILNPQAKADPFYSKTITQLSKVAEDVGLKGSASDQLKQLPKIFESIGGKIKGMLGKTKVNSNEVIDTFTNKLAETTDYVPVDKTWASVRKFFTDKVNKLGTEFSDEAVYNLKQEVADNMGNVFKKIDKGTPLSPKEQAYKAMFDSLKDVLDTKVPGIRDYNMLQHQLYELAPGLVKKSQEKIIAPIIGQLQGIPGLREGLQRLTDRTGRAMQAGGGLFDTLTKPLQTSEGQNILNQTLQKSLGIQAPSVQSVQSTETPQTQEAPTSEEIFSPQKQWKWDAKANDWVQNKQTETSTQPVSAMEGMKKIFPILMMQDLQQTGGKNIPELKTIMDSLTASEPKLSAAEKVPLMAAKDGLKLVDTLYGQYQKVQSKGLTASSPGLGRLGGIKGSIATLTQNDADAAAYEATKKAFLSKLSRASGEKGVLTDQDIKRIENALPTFYDTPDTAQTKMDLVRQVMGEAIAAKEGSVESSAGNDILMQLLGQ